MLQTHLHIPWAAMWRCIRWLAVSRCVKWLAVCGPKIFLVVLCLQMHKLLSADVLGCCLHQAVTVGVHGEEKKKRLQCADNPRSFFLLLKTTCADSPRSSAPFLVVQLQNRRLCTSSVTAWSAPDNGEVLVHVIIPLNSCYVEISHE